jgi:uncharacterized protein (DUF736 family)
MPDFDNNLRGALFKNDKQGNEKRPDYKGECEIDGEKFYLSAWIRTSKKGAKFMSLQFERPQAQSGGAAPAPATEAPVAPTTGDDDIPF